MTTYPVSLAIYDLSKGSASILSSQFFGPDNTIDILPHTAIVVYGREYYFACHLGLQSVDPNTFRTQRDMTPVEIQTLGTTTLSKEEFELWCRSINKKKQYSRNDYHVVKKNCNHFSEEARKTLNCTKQVPEWILQLPKTVLSTDMGKMLLPMLENMTRTVDGSLGKDSEEKNDAGDEESERFGKFLQEVDTDGPLTKKTRTLEEKTNSDLESTANRPQVAILDFGSQYSHLIARRIRELHVYCELYSCEVSVEELQRNNILAVILSGGPNSVYDDDAPHVREEVWGLIQRKCVPVLGICYGMQEIAHVFGGKVTPGLKREYGKALVQQDNHTNSPLFQDLPNAFQMWMSHGDKLQTLPSGFQGIASTTNANYVSIENQSQQIWGLQFHPEVTHSPLGPTILKNFIVNIAGAKQDWKMTKYAQTFIENVQKQVGETGHVIGAVSGGVDSTVAAVLLNQAIGHRFHAVMVDNGCLRKDEAKNVIKRLRDDCHVDLKCIDASSRFLSKLEGVTDPEQKRKVIGGLFIDVFQEEAVRITNEHGKQCDFLLQGTLYPDVIESISYKGPSATIKTHHNVGGLPASMNLQLIEPLRELFKDEVRELGIALGLDDISVWRHPFPGPGLAIRILGEVTAECIHTLQHADSILIEELHASKHYRNIGQAFVVLLPTVKSVGVMGDGRTYENVACVRCVETTDYMTADFYHLPHDVMGNISNRIINEVKGINRVCYDISSKPPATIEWE